MQDYSPEIAAIQSLADKIQLPAHPGEAEATLRRMMMANYERGQKATASITGARLAHGFWHVFIVGSASHQATFAQCPREDFFRACRLADVLSVHLRPYRKRVGKLKPQIFNVSEARAAADAALPDVQSWLAAVLGYLQSKSLVKLAPGESINYDSKFGRLSARLTTVEQALEKLTQRVEALLSPNEKHTA